MPAFVVAGTHSGCGKTTIVLALLAALKKIGLSIQSFKVGPDFIDGGLHRLITGKASRNLDLWMCGEEYVKTCFYKHSKDVEISIIEGVMGLYDGDASTAKLAKILNLPVILVVDAYGMAESAGALIEGFKEWGLTAGINLGGVILNRVASERHFKRLKGSVKDVPVMGYLPRELNFEIPHRHLGLTVAEENPISEENIEKLANAAIEHIDIEAIYRAAEQQTSRAAGYYDRNYSFKNYCSAALLLYCSESGSFMSSAIKIAVAYDRAFCFYYEDNLDLLKEAGAEIVTFSPLSDSKIPDDVDALYIGGGYPELYAKELSANESMLASIKKYSDTDMPIYAECGGLMYLSKGIYDFDGIFFEMANILPFETQMTKSRPRLGYREVELTEDCIIGKKGDRLRGHEFHYSEIRNTSQKSEVRSQIKKIYLIKDKDGYNVLDEGFRFKNVFASYVHVHFGSNLAIAKNFIEHLRGEEKES